MTTRPTIQVDDVTRELTNAEYDVWLAAEKDNQDKIAAVNAATAAAKLSAQNKLAALGLTESEIKAITGGN